jgi:MYXO-CTERM domain-containing protein
MALNEWQMKWSDSMSGDTTGNKSPIGLNEALAIGLGAVALLRIRRRRQKEAAERAAMEHARDAQEGSTETPSGEAKG